MTETAVISLQRVQSDDDIAATKVLFLEYAESLDFELCFQDFDREMAEFPGNYGEPEGALVLARVDGKPAGSVGLRMLCRDADIGVICEMKRLYVRDEFRGLGLGRKLAEAITAEGRRIGYTAMRLDTINTMQAAIQLYRSLGFAPIDRYTNIPIDGAEFYEIMLS